MATWIQFLQCLKLPMEPNCIQNRKISNGEKIKMAIFNWIFNCQKKREKSGHVCKSCRCFSKTGLQKNQVKSKFVQRKMSQFEPKYLWLILRRENEK